MRECWVIEEQDKETDEWYGVDSHGTREVAETNLRRWASDYKQRVVRYVPADTVAQVPVCEWATPPNNPYRRIAVCRTSESWFEELFVADFKFCPYCGKPLKLGAEAPHA